MEGRKEENSSGPSSSLGFEMARGGPAWLHSFPGFIGSRTDLQHVCLQQSVSEGTEPLRRPTRGNDRTYGRILLLDLQAFQTGPRAAQPGCG